MGDLSSFSCIFPHTSFHSIQIPRMRGRGNWIRGKGSLIVSQHSPGYPQEPLNSLVPDFTPWVLVSAQELPHLIYVILQIQPRIPCMLDKHSPNWAMLPAETVFFWPGRNCSALSDSDLMEANFFTRRIEMMMRGLCEHARKYGRTLGSRLVINILLFFTISWEWGRSWLER